MSDETIKLGLDPAQVLAALKEMATKSEELAKQIEDALGKDAAASIKKLEDTAEKGSGRIGNFFNNLGKRVKEDMKTAFDFSRVMAGVKFTDEIAKGAKQVLDMERAWDRLNVRIGASAKTFGAFKTELGKGVSATGASLEKVLPGVEAVVARGGLKDTTELGKIGEILAKAQAATGEETGNMAEQLVDSIQARGMKVNAATMKEAIDAAMAARNAGTFGTATEAASAIAHVSPFAKQMGLGTRETAALAAQASAAGGPGVDILRQLMERGTQVGQQGALNQLLGANIFKGGKLDSNALGNINLSKFKGLSEQQMAGITGFSGASGDDFVRFVQAFKQGNDRFKSVLSSSDDTAKAFEASTQNFAARLDRFKERLTNAGREIVGGLSQSAEGVFSGNKDKIKGGLAQAGAGIKDNAGTLAAGTAGTLAMGLLFGGGLRNLMGGQIGTAAGIARGKGIQQATGVQPVFVVNAKEIGGGAMEKIAPFAGLGKFGGAMGVLGAGAAGYGVGSLINEIPGVSDAVVGIFDSIAKMFGGGSMNNDQAMKAGEEQFRKAREQTEMLRAAIREGAREGTSQARIRLEQKGPMTNPSAVAPRGGGR